MVNIGRFCPPVGIIVIGSKNAPPKKPRVVTRLTANIAETTPPAIILRLVSLSIALTIARNIRGYIHQLYLVPLNRTSRPENRTPLLTINSKTKCLGDKRLNCSL